MGRPGEVVKRCVRGRYCTWNASGILGVAVVVVPSQTYHSHLRCFGPAPLLPLCCRLLCSRMLTSLWARHPERPFPVGGPQSPSFWPFCPLCSIHFPILPAFTPVLKGGVFPRLWMRRRLDVVGAELRYTVGGEGGFLAQVALCAPHGTPAGPAHRTPTRSGFHARQCWSNLLHLYPPPPALQTRFQDRFSKHYQYLLPLLQAQLLQRVAVLFWAGGAGLQGEGNLDIQRCDDLFP